MKPDERIKILVVDGSATGRRIIRNSLAELAGVTFLEADSAETALTVADEQEPDLVITDWNLPEMTVIDFAVILRHRHSHMPVLIVTAIASPLEVAMAVKAGVSDIVIKPFTAAMMTDKAKTAMDNWFVTGPS